MMKNKFIFLMLMVLAFGSSLLSLQAQEDDYIPFPTEGAVWYVNEGVGETGFVSYGAVGDTLINDTLYTKMYRSLGLGFDLSNSEYFAAYREDENKQVWAIYAAFSGKYLIYDFSLEEGESVRVYGYYANESFHARKMYVDTIMEIPRTVWEGQWGRWYEGVGAETGPLHSLWGIHFAPNISCLEQDGIVVFQSPFAIRCDSVEIFVDIEEVDTYRDFAQIYPTFLSENELLYIDLEQLPNSPLSLLIRDYTGKVVVETDISTLHSTIPLSLTKGIYFAYLTDRQGIGKPVRLFIF